MKRLNIARCAVIVLAGSTMNRRGQRRRSRLDARRLFVCPRRHWVSSVIGVGALALTAATLIGCERTATIASAPAPTATAHEAPPIPAPPSLVPSAGSERSAGITRLRSATVRSATSGAITAPTTAPYGVGVVPGNGQVTIVWRPVKGARGHWVGYWHKGSWHWEDSNGRNYHCYNNCSSYTITGLPNGVKLGFIVYAFNWSGTAGDPAKFSPASTKVTATPSTSPAVRCYDGSGSKDTDYIARTPTQCPLDNVRRTAYAFVNSDLGFVAVRSPAERTSVERERARATGTPSSSIQVASGDSPCNDTSPYVTFVVYRYKSTTGTHYYVGMTSRRGDCTADEVMARRYTGGKKPGHEDRVLLPMSAAEIASHPAIVRIFGNAPSVETYEDDSGTKILVAPIELRPAVAQAVGCQEQAKYDEAYAEGKLLTNAKRPDCPGHHRGNLNPPPSKNTQQPCPRGGSERSTTGVCECPTNKVRAETVNWQCPTTTSSNPGGTTPPSDDDDDDDGSDDDDDDDDDSGGDDDLVSCPHMGGAQMSRAECERMRCRLRPWEPGC